MNDLRYALRAMRRNPSFAAVAILMIAMSIGGTTALFSFADLVLLRTLPVASPERLVFLQTSGPAGNRTVAPAYLAFERLRTTSRTVDGIAAFATDQLALVVDGQVEQVEGQVASGDYHRVLGVIPLLGRLLTKEDERTGAAAVISYGYWQRRFAGRPDVVGTIVRRDDRALTIVGVTPKDFAGLQVGFPIDVTMPITFGARDRGPAALRWFSAVARIKPGVSVEGARAELDAIHQRFSADAPVAIGAAGRSERIQLAPAAHGLGRLRRQLAGPILMLAGLMAGVLTIACANIANLLLARSAARRREFIVRSAIGASAGRIVRHLLVESLTLFAVGAAFGLALAIALIAVLRDFLAVGRIPIQLDFAIDGRALAFTVSLCLVTAMVAGLVPAIRVSRLDPASMLRVKSGVPTSSLSRWLVTLQVAITIVILVNGSLLVRTLRGLRTVDRRFSAERVLTVSVRPLQASESDRRDRIWPEILGRVERLPGVEAAALSVLTPLSGRDRTRRIDVPGFEPRSDVDRTVRLNYVSPAYFRTFGISILRGHTFSGSTRDGGALVAIVNDAAARHYFSRREPVGGSVAFGSGPDSIHTVVAVAANAKHGSLRDDAPRFVYLPLAQGLDNPSRLTLSVRTRGDPSAFVAAVRREILAVESATLVSDVLTLDRQLDQSLLRERLVSGLSTAFAMLGLLLAAVGLYGLASYAVAQRTNELGLRMALGASPGSVQRLMLRDATRLVALGIAIGTPASLIASRAFRSLLFGVSPADPLTVAACVALLGWVVGLAAYIPARRASRIQPLVALASE